MPRLIRCGLFGLFCLLCRPACSQVYTLPAGTVVPRPLIGLDTAAYRSLRVNTALDHLQLALRAQQLRKALSIHLSDSVAASRQGAELAGTRQDNAALHEELRQEQQRTRETLALPLQRPLLLDGHFYTGLGMGGAGATLAYFVLKSIFHF